MIVSRRTQPVAEPRRAARADAGSAAARCGRLLPATPGDARGGPDPGRRPRAPALSRPRSRACTPWPPRRRWAAWSRRSSAISCEAMSEMQLVPIWQSEPIKSLVIAVHPRLPAQSRAAAAGLHARVAADRPRARPAGASGLARHGRRPRTPTTMRVRLLAARLQRHRQRLSRDSHGHALPPLSLRLRIALTILVPRGDPGGRRAVRLAAPIADHHQGRAWRTLITTPPHCCRISGGSRCSPTSSATSSPSSRSWTSARGSARSRSSTCRAGSWRRATPRRSAPGRRCR